MALRRMQPVIADNGVLDASGQPRQSGADKNGDNERNDAERRIHASAPSGEGMFASITRAAA
ncbi:MAG: hypothetical protein NTZ05_21250 [Chloroflexi bacterium]|nr:hypothetical protein [Chloroflexota bacterium]